MYTEKDMKQAKRQVLLRCGVFLLIVAVAGTGCGFCMHYRWRLANAVIAAIGALVASVYMTLKFMPWFRYLRFLKDMKEGRSHEYDASFVSYDEETSLRDGVLMHAFHVELTDADEEDKARLFFWDDDKPKPVLEAGAHIRIRAFGNYVIGVESL